MFYLAPKSRWASGRDQTQFSLVGCHLRAESEWELRGTARGTFLPSLFYRIKITLMMDIFDVSDNLKMCQMERVTH